MEGEIESQIQQAVPAEGLLGKIQQPLLENALTMASKPTKTSAQKAIRKTFKGTAHLANLLPTGTVLGFQILSPIFTHQGHCNTHVSQTTTLGLVLVCAFSCFFLLFTDSFRDGRGKVRYGVATFQGLWVIDGSVTLPKEEAAKYRLRFIDFFHAFASLLVFIAVALFDENVVKCLYPTPSDELRELLVVLPVGIGVLCSCLFIVFPTKRHGVGFPLSRQ
ncbi:hypothetical protein IC582_025700 [Cucumis melo]|uniref:Uncharacterized protein LOC103496014 n=2 Tax=Cucumis melo TaxID=3656 RepID=A0A1S3C2T3_CUCME|nr:protein DMP7 [Cucumis melo]KAA0067489.1 uncharacterized protein E6C27_scaffold40G001760 [Cucumis melo var. makuwa]TYK20425.1 uncharacterized protein E5676_scaffold604G00100 [Cucumis melo var. makuwa]